MRGGEEEGRRRGGEERRRGEMRGTTRKNHASLPISLCGC